MSNGEQSRRTSDPSGKGMARKPGTQDVRGVTGAQPPRCCAIKDQKGIGAGRKIFTITKNKKRFTMISMTDISEDEAQRFVSGKIEGAKVERKNTKY